ncbi:ITPK1-like protein, partial [Mya arenaria]
MSVIFNEDGLQNINPPCVAQTFVNHNATLYKIFKLGSKQYIGQRPSLKNLYAGDVSRLNALSETLREKLGIDLFGVDVIVECETKRYAVIDINVFP